MDNTMVLDSVDTADASAKADARGTGKLFVTGNPDHFKLLFKASNKYEGWYKSTKAMEVAGGCILQTETFYGTVNEKASSQALVFIPGVKIVEDVNGGRKLA